MNKEICEICNGHGISPLKAEKCHNCGNNSINYFCYLCENSPILLDCKNCHGFGYKNVFKKIIQE